MTRITERIEIAVDDVLKPHAVPGVLILPTWAKSRPATPGCWYGGKPTLPTHILWPLNKSVDPPMPMQFLCQLDLARYPVAVMEAFDALPRTGTLFFFYDNFHVSAGCSELSDGCAMIYVEEDVADVPPRDPPMVPALDRERSAGEPDRDRAVLEFPHSPIALCGLDTYPMDRAAFRTGPPECGIYTAIYEEAYSDWLAKMKRAVFSYMLPRKRFSGGYNTPISMGALGPEWMATAGPSGASQRLLFIQSDDGLKCKIGDLEHIHIYIDVEAMRRRDFSAIEAHYDGYDIG